MENLKNMIDADTILGDPIETKDGSYIVPVSKVSFGFASGGSEFTSENAIKNDPPSNPFGGASGAGVTLKPVAFLVVKDGLSRLLPVEADSSVDRIIDTIPQILDMIRSAIGNKKEKKDFTECDHVDDN